MYNNSYVIVMKEKEDEKVQLLHSFINTYWGHKYICIIPILYCIIVYCFLQ